jgi:hypothetical protein
MEHGVGEGVASNCVWCSQVITHISTTHLYLSIRLQGTTSQKIIFFSHHCEILKPHSHSDYKGIRNSTLTALIQKQLKRKNNKNKTIKK